MGLNPARIIRRISRNCWNLRIHVALLFVFGLAGCNTCVTFTSNPPTGTLGIVASDPRPVCNLPKMNAAVRPQLAAEPVCSSCVGSGQVQHIFLSIRGIELNSSATARDDSPDWQELLPAELEQKPLQIDLMEGKADQAVQVPFGKTALVPAGICLNCGKGPDEMPDEIRTKWTNCLDENLDEIALKGISSNSSGRTK